MKDTWRAPESLSLFTKPLPEGVRVMGELSFTAYPKTDKEVRDFLAELDKFGIPDEHEMYDGVLFLVKQSESVGVTLCGDHLIGEEKYDILIQNHYCEDWHETDN
jgi:hypothetical protein